MDAINKIMQTPSPARHEPNHTIQFIPHTHTHTLHPIQCEHYQSSSRNREPVLVVGFIFILALYIVCCLLPSYYIKLFKYKCLTALVLRKLPEDKMLIQKFPPFCLQPDSPPYSDPGERGEVTGKLQGKIQHFISKCEIVGWKFYTL